MLQRGPQELQLDPKEPLIPELWWVIPTKRLSLQATLVDLDDAWMAKPLALKSNSQSPKRAHAYAHRVIVAGTLKDQKQCVPISLAELIEFEMETQAWLVLEKPTQPDWKRFVQAVVQYLEQAPLDRLPEENVSLSTEKRVQ